MSKAGSLEELFQRGIDLFNQGRFFEAHEAWEAAWLRSTGEERLLYQGMIQAAAALLHAQRGNLDGSRSLWSKAMAKLDPLPADFRGIALGELRQQLTRYFDLSACAKAPALPIIRRMPMRADE